MTLTVFFVLIVVNTFLVFIPSLFLLKKAGLKQYLILFHLLVHCLLLQL